MKQKIVIIIILAIVIAIGLFFLSTGGKMAGIFLDHYSVSEDGKVMTLSVGVASSMGYVRSLKVKQDDNKEYLTFYSTYGLNCTIGAKNEFQIDMKPSVDQIYFYRGDTGYELILQKKDGTNEWQLVR